MASVPWWPVMRGSTVHLICTRFLVAAGVADYTSQLVGQRVDLEAVMMLSDQDLVTLGLPLGPRRKLLNAIQERRRALTSPGEIQDSWL
ncbi:Usher syndrome type-1G protein [Homalodisca vitripennis]|nr:Usher syndrome type-1G protein [Homalodisca vitripennis]